MKRFELNKKSLRSILEDTGMDSSYIANSDTAVIDENIEKLKNVKLKPVISIGNLSPRGSVYLMLKRFFTSNQINSDLARIKP